MAFVKRWGGQLNPYPREFDPSRITQEVTLDEYLDQRYPQGFVAGSVQARAYRQQEQDLIQAEIQPGDTLWLWQEGEWPFDQGGLAVKRGGEVVRVWLTWMHF